MDTKRERLILLSTLRPNFMLRWLILSNMTRERPPPFYSELDVETDTELQSLALPLNLWSTKRERLIPSADPDPDRDPDLVMDTKRERLILLSTLRPNFMLRWLILSTMTRERPPPFYSELDVETDTELQSL